MSLLGSHPLFFQPPTRSEICQSKASCRTLTRYSDGARVACARDSDSGGKAMRSRLGYLLLFLLDFSVPLKAQIEPIPTLKVQPIPLPGGDIFPPYGLYNQFFPGPLNQNPPFDPMNADPQGITNFRGVAAMGYTSGFTTDKKLPVV